MPPIKKLSVIIRNILLSDIDDSEVFDNLYELFVGCLKQYLFDYGIAEEVTESNGYLVKVGRRKIYLTKNKAISLIVAHRPIERVEFEGFNIYGDISFISYHLRKLLESDIRSPTIYAVLGELRVHTLKRYLDDYGIAYGSGNRIKNYYEKLIMNNRP